MSKDNFGSGEGAHSIFVSPPFHSSLKKSVKKYSMVRIKERKKKERNNETMVPGHHTPGWKGHPGPRRCLLAVRPNLFKRS